MRPPGAVQVEEADLRRLGVHAAISAAGISDEIPPEYVSRDTDTDEHGVRAKIAAASQRGGFVLLTGGSSVGKTRCAAEAVKALLPDWWLIHPDGPAEVAAMAAAPPARTVVWLDDLQRCLDGEQGLAAGTVRSLLNAPAPVVIIGTLWPDRYAAYTAVPQPGDPDPHAREREVLEPASHIRLRSQFTTAEQGRARAAAKRDPRLAAAVRAEGYGLTQTLAAAPQLVARWEDAQETDPYAWAVLTAALDAARLGARAPLTADLLRSAAPGYCTSAQQAEAPANWFEQALAYATAKLHGAAAALAPAGAGMGQIAGYSVADYLLQHAARERRAARVPASTWDALLSHISDPADARRIADSAAGRLLYRFAIPLFRSAADAGDQNAAVRLAGLLADPGELDELRARADAGDSSATSRLAGILASQGNLDELRARADAGDSSAASRLAGILASQANLDELRARADAGDSSAASRLAGILASQGNLDELRARADAGDSSATRRLAGILADRGELDELRARADAGDSSAASRLAGILASQGNLDELRARADAGDFSAASLLAGILASQGNLDELRARADAGNSSATSRLAGILADRGELDELQARADAGNFSAAYRLAGILASQANLDELRARADAGDSSATSRLAGILADRGS